MEHKLDLIRHELTITHHGFILDPVYLEAFKLFVKTANDLGLNGRRVSKLVYEKPSLDESTGIHVAKLILEENIQDE